MRTVLGACLLAGIMSQPTAAEAAPDSGPKVRSQKELGQVRWWRDYDAAKAEAKKRQRPLLILFDEVPG